MTAQSHSLGVHRPAIWMILIAGFLDMVSMGIVFPVLPVLIEELTGSSAAAGLWTGIIGSLWATMQFIASPVIGSLADRFGRRPVILVSTAGLALDWVLMALAPSLWWLVVGRALGGLTSASGTALFAYMADVTEPERRTRAFGLLGAVISAGFVIGPALGGLLGEWSPRLPFWVAAALSAMAFLYGLLVLPESLPPDRRAPFVWRRAHPLASLRMLASKREVGGLATGFFLLTFAHRLFTTVFVLYAGHRHGLSLFEIGALLAMSSVLDLVMQGALVGPATERLGERRTMILGLTGGGVSLAAMGLAPGALWFILALIPSSLWGLAEPTMKSLMSRRFSENEQGQLQGATQSVASLAGITGPLFFGWIYGLSSISFPSLSFFLAAGTLALAALCSAWAVSGRAIDPHRAKGTGP